MGDLVTLDFDPTSFDRAGDKIVRLYLTAGADAVRGTTKWLERRMEDATRGAVPGNLWRAWKSEAFPKSGAARSPAGIITLNGKGRTRGAMAFWTQPGQVRGKQGQYLAIPLPAAGSRGRGRDLTPAEWESSTGQRLIFLYRQGKPSLLVAIGTTNGRSGVFRPLTDGRTKRGRGGANPQANSVVPIFVLVPMVPFRNALAIAPIIASAQGEMTQEFLDGIARAGA
jgi:hypothetical protein